MPASRQEEEEEDGWMEVEDEEKLGDKRGEGRGGESVGGKI